MRNPVAKAWICVGIMMLGVVLMMTSMAFLGNKVLLYLFLISGIAVFIAGIVLHLLLLAVFKYGNLLLSTLGTAGVAVPAVTRMIRPTSTI